jgi:hypothetical protein
MRKKLLRNEYQLKYPVNMLYIAFLSNAFSSSKYFRGVGCGWVNRWMYRFMDFIDPGEQDVKNI